MGELFVALSIRKLCNDPLHLPKHALFITLHTRLCSFSSFLVNIGGGDEEMVDDGEPCCCPPPAWPVATTMDSNTKANIIVVVLKEVLFVQIIIT